MSRQVTVTHCSLLLELPTLAKTIRNEPVNAAPLEWGILNNATGKIVQPAGPSVVPFNDKSGQHTLNLFRYSNGVKEVFELDLEHH